MKNVLKQFQVLHQDRHLIAVNKFPGILSLPDQSERLCVHDAVRQYIQKEYHLSNLPWLAPVHRLDIGSSGVLIFAKSSKAASRLGRQFNHINTGSTPVEKRYLAVVRGSFSSSSGIFVHKLRKVMNTARPSRVKIIHRITTNHRVAEQEESENRTKDQLASLSWKVIGECRDFGQSLIEVLLHTGRRHQIRSQLAYEGLPIIGDQLYAPPHMHKSKSWLQMEQKRSIALHSAFIRVLHPKSSEKLIITARVPELWRKVFGPQLEEMANVHISLLASDCSRYKEGEA